MLCFSSIGKGVRGASPIVLGYLPIGMAYGLLAQQTGLEIGVTLSLSLFVFAGASQFMAVSMLFRGTEALVIIGTVFIVNFRHLLMSASITPYLASWKRWQRLMLGSMLTDESFAVHSVRFARNDLDPTAAIALNITAYAAWAVSGVVGFYLGSLIAEPEVWGLDFALPAMFVGLLLPVCGQRPAAVAALCGGAVSVLLHTLGVGAWAAFAGALIGATAGLCVKEAKHVG